METIKLLFVEDHPTPIKTFETELMEFNEEQSNYKIDSTLAETYSEAIEKIDKSFDAIIMDLALGKEEDAGNNIVLELENQKLRIPIIFVSGNHARVNKNPLIINARARDEGSYEEDFQDIIKIYKTGLTNILGSRGEIEKKLSEIFTDTVLPELDTWKQYASEQKEEKQTEKALLRLVVNHLNHLLEEEDIPSYPEEFYIYPVKDAVLRTGTILKSKSSDNIYYISLSPACDLAQRDGKCKTDRLLIAEIELLSNIRDQALAEFNKQTKNAELRRKIKSRLQSLFGNNFTNYYHCLPEIKRFSGGFINFRKAKSLTQNELDDKMEIIDIQISAPYIKDILSRFSSYYARQGQPVITFESHIKDIVNKYKE